MHLRLVIALGLFSSVASAKDLPPLPQKIEVSINMQSSAQLHGRALQRFRDAFKPDPLRVALEEVGSKPDDVHGELVTTLKELRKHGTILRSAYQSLDEKHVAPVALDRFVRVFGKLNDAIENKVPGEVSRQSRRLGKLLDEQKLGSLEAALSSFQPTSKAGFDRYVAESLQQLHTAVDREVLPAEDFHKVRKSLKNLLAVVHLLEDSPGETHATHETFEHLNAINDLLGKEHDDLVRKDLKGKASYDATTVKVPGEVRASIAALRDRFRNAATE